MRSSIQQADCLAGAWVGSLRERDGAGGLSVGPDDLNKAITANLQIADPIGLASMTPGAHGTGFDRLRAFAEGFNDGAVRCSEYIVRPPEPMELPFTLTASTRGDEKLEDLIPIVIATLEAYWGFVFPDLTLPATSGFDIDVDQMPACAGGPRKASIAGAVLCTADTTVHYDEAAQRRLWKTTGDAAAIYGLVHAWTQQVAVHLIGADDPTRVVLASDCLTGVWHRKLVDEYERLQADAEARPRYSLFLAAGDLDEVLAGLLLTPTLGPNGSEVAAASPFDRAGAFSNGFLESEAACDLD